MYFHMPCHVTFCCERFFTYSTCKCCFFGMYINMSLQALHTRKNIFAFYACDTSFVKVLVFLQLNEGFKFLFAYITLTRLAISYMIFVFPKSFEMSTTRLTYHKNQSIV